MDQHQEERSTFTKTTKIVKEIHQSSQNSQSTIQEGQDEGQGVTQSNLLQKLENNFFVTPYHETGFLQNPSEINEMGGAPKEISSVITNEMFEVVYDVSKFKPEEIEVKVSKSIIQITGKQIREFSRRCFTTERGIPDQVDPNSLKSTFTPEGHLRIFAPIAKEFQKSSPESTNPIGQEFSIVDHIGTQNSGISVNRNFEDHSHHTSITKDGEKFKVTIDLKEYKLEEIKIRVTGTVLRVDASREGQYVIGIAKGEHESHFFKEMSLPSNVDLKSLASIFSKDGVLTITANLV